MMTPEQRAELLASLNALSAEGDEEALAAARNAARQVEELQTSWDALLADAADDVDEAEAEEPEAPPAEEAETPTSKGEHKEALKLIDGLLARDKLLDATRDDLLAYKEDIAAGEFLASDLRYLKALNSRLQGKR